MWFIYWIFLIISFFFGINVFIKKQEFSGVVQALLSVVLPIWAIFFELHRDFNRQVNELEFIFSKIASGSLEAILIMLGYIVLILLFGYNMYKLKKN